MRIDRLQVIRNQQPIRFRFDSYISEMHQRVVVLRIWRSVYYICLWRVTTTSKGE